jgi:membrane-associated phospholipid phosphatase
METIALSPRIRATAQHRTARELWKRVWPLAVFNVAIAPSELFRGIADNIGPAAQAQFSLLQRLIFFTGPSRLLQSLFLFRPFEVTATVAYLSWMVLPILAGVPLIRRAPEDYWKLLALMAITYTVSMPLFALYPLQPPWIHDPSIVHVPDRIAPWLAGRDANVYATFPSMHVAVPAAAALWYGWRDGWGRALWAYTGLIALAVVYTGDHYLADVAAGVLVAFALHGIAVALNLPFIRAREHSFDERADALREGVFSTPRQAA